MSKDLFNVCYTLAGFSPWQKQEIARIEKLTSDEVLIEVQNIMNGQNYSWYSLDKRLRDIEITSALYSEWALLWEAKRNWDKASHLVQSLGGSSSDTSAIFSYVFRRNLWRSASYRCILLTLKILPTYSGLKAKGIRLVMENVDKY
ncbi:hypothetical protein NA56DRAFT_94734 [Hyaloscypha hepaticicola]|uniref:Uncharacterized protein n=1 Tax=Hyaloscypha hepaticicola TaxID=2082293 RepID=A0A2J6Q8T1_9HELO|nr:hypothetical protein NA56DRAFT_94734 [Hyaloscypha hepaticicola]